MKILILIINKTYIEFKKKHFVLNKFDDIDKKNWIEII